jgi:hypothetical protein
MKYWLTTQWPPLKGRNYPEPFDSQDKESMPYVWLRHGDYEKVGKGLGEGDLVVVYEVGSGPMEVRIDGRALRFPCQGGCTGLIFYGSVKSGFEQRQGSREAEYVWQNREPDRQRMWWEWRAPIKVPSEIFPEVLRERRSIPFTEVKRALRGAEEPMDFNPRNFGGGTGLKEIKRSQYEALIKLFDGASSR